MANSFAFDCHRGHCHHGSRCIRDIHFFKEPISDSLWLSGFTGVDWLRDRNADGTTNDCSTMLAGSGAESDRASGLMFRPVARLVLWLAGWSPVGEIPDDPKAVCIAAPHTSNWDGFWALTYKVAVGIDVRFFAKHSLFWFPLGPLLRSLGGIPLDRSRATSAVQRVVAMFESQEHFYFGLAPEGTRARRDAWKTGFYRIAKLANVPVFLGILDYKNKRVGITGRLELTDDIAADLQKCADFYANIEGRWPEKTTPVRAAE